MTLLFRILKLLAIAFFNYMALDVCFRLMTLPHDWTFMVGVTGIVLLLCLDFFFISTVLLRFTNHNEEPHE